MSGDLRDHIAQSSPEEKRKTGRKTYVFLIFLTISIGIWLLIKLSKDYYSIERRQLHFYNIPPGEIISSISDTVLFLTVKSTGFNLIRARLFPDNTPLKINLGNIKIKNTASGQEGILADQELLDLLNSQVGDYKQISSITPKSLSLEFEFIRTKKVPVKLNINIGFEPQYGLYNKVYIDPDSVVVGGPSEMLRNLSYIETKDLKLDKIRSNSYFTVGLKTPGKGGCLLYCDFIKVFIPVAEFTESEQIVDIVFDSVPEGFSVKTFPDKVKVTYRIALCDYKMVKAEDFHIGGYWSDLEKNSSGKIKVEVIQAPECVRVTSVDPDNIEFIIQK